MLDINFDMRKDSNGKDPDKYSHTLKNYHTLLWSKKLPNGDFFRLENEEKKYLIYRGKTGDFSLGSDSVIPSYARWKKMGTIIEKIPFDILEDFMIYSYTIGGMMIFPSYKINNKPSINMFRGISNKISDRMDITLDCIMKFYNGEDNLMQETLLRYADFFRLFRDFRGYTDFFYKI